jgi:uncharacterized repeat protein (TIGR03803 family)
VFEIVKTGNTYASTPVTLVSFNSKNGANPNGSLIFDAKGNLFGTTTFGGTNNYGTVFEIVNTGTNTYASTLITLVNFNDSNLTVRRPARDANGNLFGTTHGDGTLNGAVFEIVTPWRPPCRGRARF